MANEVEGGQAGEGQKINVNSATKEDLMKIPGIGEDTAQKIIDYRDREGGIKDISELMNAEGLNEKELEPLKQWLEI